VTLLPVTLGPFERLSQLLPATYNYVICTVIRMEDKAYIYLAYVLFLQRLSNEVIKWLCLRSVSVMLRYSKYCALTLNCHGNTLTT